MDIDPGIAVAVIGGWTFNPYGMTGVSGFNRYSRSAEMAVVALLPTLYRAVCRRTWQVGASRSVVLLTSGESIMNKFGKLLSAAFLAVTLVSFVGCGSTDTKAGTGEYVDDSVITTKVKAAIFNEPTLSSAEFNVETFKGVVQLSGFVGSQNDMTKAIQLASNVKGVKTVKNDMQLK